MKGYKSEKVIKGERAVRAGFWICMLKKREEISAVERRLLYTSHTSFLLLHNPFDPVMRGLILGTQNLSASTNAVLFHIDT